MRAGSATPYQRVTDAFQTTFFAIAADPKLSHGETLRKAMLAMIDGSEHPYIADPKFWAPSLVQRLDVINEVVANYQAFIPIICRDLPSPRNKSEIR